MAEVSVPELSVVLDPASHYRIVAPHKIQQTSQMLSDVYATY